MFHVATSPRSEGNSSTIKGEGPFCNYDTQPQTSWPLSVHESLKEPFGANQVCPRGVSLTGSGRCSPFPSGVLESNRKIDNVPTWTRRDTDPARAFHTWPACKEDKTGVEPRLRGGTGLLAPACESDALKDIASCRIASDRASSGHGRPIHPRRSSLRHDRSRSEFLCAGNARFCEHISRSTSPPPGWRDQTTEKARGNASTGKQRTTRGPAVQPHRRGVFEEARQPRPSRPFSLTARHRPLAATEDKRR